jgi:hypothetical protein
LRFLSLSVFITLKKLQVTETKSEENTTEQQQQKDGEDLQQATNSVVVSLKVDLSSKMISPSKSASEPPNAQQHTPFCSEIADVATAAENSGTTIAEGGGQTTNKKSNSGQKRAAKTTAGTSMITTRGKLIAEKTAPPPLPLLALPTTREQVSINSFFFVSE